MEIGVISGVISGLVCTFFVALITNNFNAQAKYEVMINIERLRILIDSINNDLTWGNEDEKPDYYDNLIVKVLFAYSYLDNARFATKRFNFLFHNRKNILMQYVEIEKSFNKILCEAQGVDGDLEKIYRLKALSAALQTITNNILSLRVLFIIKLINTHSLDDALDESCIDDTEESIIKIRKMLSRCNEKEKSKCQNS